MWMMDKITTYNKVSYYKAIFAIIIIWDEWFNKKCKLVTQIRRPLLDDIRLNNGGVIQKFYVTKQVNSEVGTEHNPKGDQKCCVFMQLTVG